MASAGLEPGSIIVMDRKCITFPSLTQDAVAALYFCANSSKVDFLSYKRFLRSSDEELHLCIHS